jgi:hypothetical protein
MWIEGVVWEGDLFVNWLEVEFGTATDNIDEKVKDTHRTAVY